MKNRLKYDPYLSDIYDSLLKQDVKELTPMEQSESWELLKYLYKRKRRRQWMQWLTGSAIAVTAAVVGIFVYQALRQNAEKNS